MKLNFERLASELMRALRGRRSQTAFARRLGYRSNVLYNWESGRAFPTAAQALRVAERAGVDAKAALVRFYRRPPAWLEAERDVTRPAAVARLMDDLRGRVPVVTLAQTLGRSRFSVARWLKGETEPRLPDFLRVVEGSSLRLLDFLSALVDPSELPSVADAWLRLEIARRATYDVPWSQAVLRALELRDYRALPRHEPGFVARRLGISRQDEVAALDLLSQSHQVRLEDGKYVPTEIRAIDTRGDREAAERLRVFWAQVGWQRLQAGAEGVFAHNLFGVSEADLARIRELQNAYYRELRSIVAQSQPVERVVLANLHLLTLA